MTFVHIGQVTQMKKSRGFSIWFQGTNHSKEEREAEVVRKHVLLLCKDFGYNVNDVKQHNKKGMELIH